ncbi:segregation and condensation protein A [Fusibacter ferrireducens]|uniref:Segregation and condensation protein A n=1 Tax=Fusibacter ferrireducens TaxID=2785058 RepID=A0ABR9ZT69_9FIRM|nr:segregation/condensation protein A [Fusibacter ferrireducens]MBF4693667.1 segregation/condensation protein A [Fusibacter ferrireducens]
MSIDVQIEAFEGPLDLLLHLISKEEIDIYDIPIVKITTQYLEIIKEMDLDRSTEFLVMAATLIEIKSRMLLPEKDESMEYYEYSDIDPRRELVKRLIEYKRFKEAAEKLRATEGTLDEVVFKDQEELGQYVKQISIEELNKNLESELLIEAVQRLMTKMNRFDEHRKGFFKGIKRDAFTVEEKLAGIRKRLKGSAYFVFSDLFENELTKEEIVVTFLAVLELLKLKEISIEQDGLFEEIKIKKRVYVEQTTIHGDSV